jgi:Holliday junction DNA helicase RuvA
MLAYLKGKLVDHNIGEVVLEVNGIAFRLYVPTSLNQRLPSLGEEVKLLTHLLWREDGPSLYGFIEFAEVELFVRLLTVSGIGAKVALAILSFAPPARILTWLIYEDVSELRKIPGIGLKTAQRLVLELREKASALSKDTGTPGYVPAEIAKDSPAAQALEALLSLGFDSASAAKAITAVAKAEMTLEQLIAAALRQLAS